MGETTNSATMAVVNSLPRRPFQPLFVLSQVAACLLVIAGTTYTALGLRTGLACVVSTYFLFDIYSGWVHYCLDWEGFNTLPLFGPLSQTFQHHHKDTTFIWRSNVWTNLSEVGLFLHISDTLPLAVLCYKHMYLQSSGAAAHAKRSGLWPSSWATGPPTSRRWCARASSASCSEP